MYIWVVPSRNLLPNSNSLTYRNKVQIKPHLTVEDVIAEVSDKMQFTPTDALLCTTPYGPPLQDDVLIRNIPGVQDKGKLFYMRNVNQDNWSDLLSKLHSYMYSTAVCMWQNCGCYKNWDFAW